MNDKAAFKAGLFILATVALVIVMVLAIAGAGGLLRDLKTYTIEFTPGENVAALKDGGHVRMLGVSVGTITAVRAVPDPTHGVLVQVEIQIPAEFVVRDGAEVLAAASLTGDAWIDFNNLGNGDTIADGGTLDGEVHGMGEALAQVATLVPEAKKAMARINAAAASFETLADNANARVDPAMTSFTNFTDRSAEVAVELRDVLGDTKVDIRTTIASLRDTLGTAKDRLPTTLDKLDAALDDTKTLMAGAKTSLDRLPAVLDRVEPALDDGKAFIAGLRGTLDDNRVRIDRIITSATRTADDLKGTVAEVRAAPWRLLYKPDAKDQRNLALYAAARQYAFGAQDLETAARSLEAAMNTADAGHDPQTIATLRQQLMDSYEQFSQVQDDLWDQFQP